MSYKHNRAVNSDGGGGGFKTFFKLVFLVGLLALGGLYWISRTENENSDQQIETLTNELNALRSANGDLIQSGAGSTNFESEFNDFTLRLHSQFQLVVNEDSETRSNLTIGRSVGEETTNNNVVIAGGAAQAELTAYPIEATTVGDQIDAVIASRSDLPIERTATLKVQNVDASLLEADTGDRYYRWLVFASEKTVYVLEASAATKEDLTADGRIGAITAGLDMKSSTIGG